MRWPQVVGPVLLVAGIVFLAGCGEVDTVVVDQMVSIADGAGHSWKLEPGRHKVEVTASDDGVTVKFVGCSCPGSERETQTFSTICDMAQTGQLTIDNPTLLGTGSGSTVTVKVTKLAQ